MPRANIAIILIVIASMLGIWYFGDVYQGEDAPPLVATEAVEVANPTRGEAEISPTPATNAAVTTEQVRQDLLALQNQLTQKSQELEAHRQALEQLRQRQATLAGSTNLSSQLQSRDLAIQGLLDELGSYRVAEEDINQSAANALRNQDSQAALARADIDARVQVLEREIRNTENELNYWKTVPFGPEVLQQPAQIERLQLELSQQMDQLNTLRAERVAISASILSNSQQIQSLAEQARAELRESAAVTQAQVYSLRADMARLGQAQASSRTQLQALNQQIEETQRSFDASSVEVRRLQESIQQLQSEIDTQ